jgi:hypothetical protein
MTTYTTDKRESPVKIKYKKKRFTFNLALAILWTVLGFLSLKYSGNNSWTDFGYLFVALLYWIGFVTEKMNQYLIITSKSIKKNSPFGKTIKWSEIMQINIFAGDYILKTDQKKMKIQTNIIDPESLEYLKLALRKVDLPAGKNPFDKTV